MNSRKTTAAIIAAVVGLMALLAGVVQAAPLSQVDLNSGLVAFWNLNETSGNRSDASGNGHTLTDNNTVGYTAGKINNAADFVAANNEYLSAGDLLGTQWSLSGWVKTAGYYMILSAWDTATNNRQIMVMTDGTINYSSSGTAYSGNLSSSTMQSGNWEFFVVTYDGTTVKIYRNGTLSNSAAVTIYNSAAAFKVGAAAGGVGYLTGQIDALGVWSRALNSDEIAALYNSGNGYEYTAPTPTPTNTPTATATFTPTATPTSTPTATPTTVGNYTVDFSGGPNGWIGIESAGEIGPVAAPEWVATGGLSSTCAGQGPGYWQGVTEGPKGPLSEYDSYVVIASTHKLSFDSVTIYRAGTPSGIVNWAEVAISDDGETWDFVNNTQNYDSPCGSHTLSSLSVSNKYVRIKYFHRYDWTVAAAIYKLSFTNYTDHGGPTPTPTPPTCILNNYDFSTDTGWDLEGYPQPAVINDGHLELRQMSYAMQSVSLTPHTEYNVVLDIDHVEWWNPIGADPSFTYDQIGLNVALLGGSNQSIWFDSPGVYTATVATLNVPQYTLQIDELAEVPQEIFIDSICLKPAREDGSGNEQVTCIAPNNGDFSIPNPTSFGLAKGWKFFNGAAWDSGAQNVHLPLNPIQNTRGLIESASTYDLPELAEGERLLLRYKTWNEHGGEGRAGVALYDDPGEYFETIAETFYTPYTYEFDVSTFAGRQVQVLASNPGIVDETFGLYGDNTYLDDVCLFVSGRTPIVSQPSDSTGPYPPIKLIGNKISSCADVDNIWAGFNVNMADYRARYSAGTSFWDPSGWVPWLSAAIFVAMGNLSCMLFSAYIGLLASIEYGLNSLLNFTNWLSLNANNLARWLNDWFVWFGNWIRYLFFWLSGWLGYVGDYIYNAAVWIGSVFSVWWDWLLAGWTEFWRWLADTWTAWWDWMWAGLAWLWDWLWAWVANWWQWLLNQLGVVYDIYTFFVAVLGMFWLLAVFVWENVANYGSLPLQFYYAFDQSLNASAYNPLVECSSANFWCTFLAGVQLINQSIAHTILYPIVIVAIILSTITILWRDIRNLFSAA